MAEFIVIEYLDEETQEWNPVARVFDENAAMVCARAIDEHSTNLVRIVKQDKEM